MNARAKPTGEVDGKYARVIRVKVQCPTPAKRVALAALLRARRHELGHTAADMRVKCEGAFTLFVEGEEEIVKQYLSRAT